VRSTIWVKKSARLRNLIILVIFPIGLKFSATSRREILEFYFYHLRFTDDRIIKIIPITINEKKILSIVELKITPNVVKPIPNGSKTCLISLFIFIKLKLFVYKCLERYKNKIEYNWFLYE